MYITHLKSFIPPPPAPFQNSGDWSAAEAELGFGFPSDFKDLIHTYGSGEFFGTLGVENPLRPWGRDGIRGLLASYRELRDACEYTFPLFPESPGLLSWGSDHNGHRPCPRSCINCPVSVSRESSCLRPSLTRRVSIGNPKR